MLLDLLVDAAACNTTTPHRVTPHQLKESSMKIDGVKAEISVNDKKIHGLLKMMVTA